MDSRVRLHQTGYLTNIQRKRCFFKGLLHLSRTKRSQISIIPRASAFRKLMGLRAEIESAIRATDDFAADFLYALASFFDASGDGLVTEAIVWVARPGVL